MTDHPNIAAALAAFQGEMPVVAKTKKATVPTKTGGQYSYTYADLAGVTEAAMPVLAKHGLSFTCSPRASAAGLELRATLLHTSGEARKGSLPIRGATPQEIGSSLTYMRRYLLGCLTGIVTEDDDDGTAASKTRKAAAQPEEPPATRRMSRPPAEPKMITPPQLSALHAVLDEAGITERDVALDYYERLIGHRVESSKELTTVEASRVIDALRQDAQAPA